jgi:hypothetical protein
MLCHGSRKTNKITGTREPMGFQAAEAAYIIQSEPRHQHR